MTSTTPASSSAHRNGSVDQLTGVYTSIPCLATDDPTTTTPELDDIAVQHFWDTLAEVAITVVNRRNEVVR